MHSILIIGCGSIGERHLRCFQQTGRCTVSACDANATLLSEVRQRYNVKAYSSFGEAISTQRFDAWIICTPAHTHLAIAREGAAHGASLLIEKPLSVTLDDVEETRAVLVKSSRFVAVAYVYHCFPWLVAAREFLLSGVLGKPRHVSVVAGQHFPTFRPAYRDIYYARHETGGGAVQDALTHLMNAMEWLIGPMTRVFCDAAHQQLEGVTVEDTVNVVARHGTVLASYAMTQFQAANEAIFEIHCERGSLKIESHAQRWGSMKLGETEWTWHTCAPLERDTLFIAQANAFLDGMESKDCALCTFDEAVQTLRCNRAALDSFATGMPIILS